MKHIIAIKLALLLVMLAGMLPLHPGLRGIARALTKRQIIARGEAFDSLSSLIAVSMITANDWEEAGREFRHNFVLYDIIDSCEVAGRKYYRCISDELEMSAEAAADEAVTALTSPQPHTPRGRLAKAIADWLAGLFMESEEQPPIFCLPYTKRAFSLASANGWQVPYLARAQPPPETVGEV